jgi:ligand-binding sensor domain-containing protein/signal transduction histidine kinase
MTTRCRQLVRLWLPLFLLTTLCQAQLPSISFETITIKDGLPSNTVYFATKDRQGFMWFGTRICPTRYDGASFRSFLQPETNLVTGIGIDTHNTAWISSDRSGICTIAANALTMQSLPAPSKRTDPQSGNFFIDSHGKGWYADQKGVNQIDLETRQTRHYPFRQTTFVWIKASFLEDAQHNLWIVGTDNGLFRYDRQRDKLVCVLGADCEDPKRRDPIVFSQGCFDSEGFLWVGTHTRGLIRYDPYQNTYQAFTGPDVPGTVMCVSEGVDENGKKLLWIGTNDELGVFRPEQQKYYAFPQLFPDSYIVYSIFRDPDNGITWICTSEGILKYHPQSNRIQRVQIPPGLVPFPVVVNTFVQDACDVSGNTFWLGLSHDGLLEWNQQSGRFQHVPLPKGITNADIRWMVQRPDGTLWMGVNRWDYQRGGLFVYDPKSRRFLHPPLVQLTQSMYSVSFFMYGFFDAQQRLWIGNSDEGIHVFDEKTNREVTPWPVATQQTLQKNSNLINDMRIDRHGNVWLATLKGVYYADEARKRFVNVDSLIIRSHPTLDMAANSLYEDHQGHLWTTRWGNVSERNAKGAIKTLLTTKDGLYDRENNGLTEDRFGNIWIGNFEGMHCYNPATKRLVRFTINDGLSQNNTLRRIFVANDGTTLLIGQKNGFNIANITNLVQKSTLPPLAISSLQVHDKPLQSDFSKPIRLSRTDNAFTVNFIALNYTKIQNNQYAYFLEGFDQAWKYSGAEHLAYYTNLDPGSYTLHLKAGDAFGNWNPKEIRLSITILPAFYETWWFKVLAFAAVAGLLYALYRYRVQQILRLQKVRNRISADLHDEIGSSLSGISIMGMMARQGLQEQHPSTPFLTKMLEEVHRISGSMDDIVWSINPRNDELSILISRMVRYASELLEAKNIAYRIDLPENIEHLKLNMEQRRDFYLIFKEAVNNLAKYSQCTQAQIAIQVHHHRLQLIVTDNGIGFDPTQHQERNGLRNLQKRAENLKGSLHIQSELGQGTILQLNFPVVS